MSSSANLYGVAVGTASTSGLGISPIVTVRAPASTDIRGPSGPLKIGQNWVDSIGNSVYELTSFSSSNGTLSANWIALGGGSTTLSTLSGDTGTANPSNGNIQIAGTANEITTAASGSTVTISVPSSFIAPGSITATVGNITATNGNFVKTAAGNKDVYSSVATTTTAGANSAGTVTLVGGTATVATTAVTASSKIRMTRQGIGATGAAALGILTVGTISAGVSFVINAVQAADATALQASDVSSIWWEIVN